jgi:tetratricopeptide (TPR) repeat protein
MYAPITWIGYAVAYGLGKDNALLYHLLSLLVHTFNTWLVYRLLVKLEVRNSLILPISILFAIHPIQVESVSWIAGFSTPLYSMFSLLSFSFYLDYAGDQPNRYRTYALALGMFVLACLAKSAAVTVPLTLIVLDWWKKPERLTRLQQWAAYVPFFLLSLGFGLLTIYSREQAGTMVGTAVNGYSALERVLLVCYAPLFYMYKMLVPLQLNVYYSFDRVNGQLPWQYFAAPLALAAMAWSSWRYRKEAPYLGIGLLFFMSNIIVALPFATLGTFELCADHYNYIACIGIFFILTEGLLALQNRFPNSAGAFKTLGYVWLAAMFVLCFRQIRIWKDSITVISHAIDNGFYHQGMMYMGRGVAYGDIGRPEEAIQDFTRAIEIDPTKRDAYKFRGSLYGQAGQLDLALADLKKYVALDPADAVSWNNIAMIHMRKGELQDALYAFTKTIEIKPDAAISYQNRARIYEMMGNTAMMQADLAKARQLAGK